MIEPPIAFLPSVRLSAPELAAEVFTNERMRVEIAQDYAGLRERGVLLFLTSLGSFATQLGSNQLMTLSRPGQPGGFKQDFEGLFVCGPIEQAQHAKNGQLGTLAKPGLVRFHYFPGMGSLPYVLSKPACHFGTPSEYRRYMHPSDSCPTALEPDNGH